MYLHEDKRIMCPCPSEAWHKLWRYARAFLDCIVKKVKRICQIICYNKENIGIDNDICDSKCLMEAIICVRLQ